jgi:hypothetical protein
MLGLFSCLGSARSGQDPLDERAGIRPSALLSCVPGEGSARSRGSVSVCLRIRLTPDPFRKNAFLSAGATEYLNVYEIASSSPLVGMCVTLHLEQ